MMEMEGILVLDHVAKHFGSINALSDVSFEIQKGKIVGIIGPNGAGKSTLFNMICGIYHLDKGRIFFNGKRIEKLMPHQICRLGIGRTFQLSETFNSLTALECIALAASIHLPLKEARRLAEKLLDRFGMTDKSYYRCENLTPVDMRLIELSKALATRPKLILLDEVMTGLTHVEAELILSRIKELSEEGITPIIVEHGMHLIVAACQRVVVLNFGCVIADGTCQEVMTNKAVIDAYLGEEPAYAT